MEQSIAVFNLLYIVGWTVLGLFILLILLGTSHLIVIIGGEQIGIVERKYFGRRLPSDRVVAMPGEIGIQARTLGPGMHLFFPYLYRISKLPFIKINDHQIGLVEAIDGKPLEPGMIFARSAEGHDHYQNGEAFLHNGGQKGPQCDIIPPGTYRINTYLFRVEITDTIVISQGQVGIVTAADGAPMDPGRLLGKSAPGHNKFQNGDAFLNNAGQKGPQMDLLLPGVYRINTRMFNIKPDNACRVPTGKVGLVTANDGAPLPEHELVARSVEGHDTYQNAAFFLNNGGQRGPQQDVLTPGIYYINPLMFTVELDDALVVSQGQVAVIISNVGKEPGFALSGDPAAIPAPPGGSPPNASATGPGEDEARKIERYVVPKGYRGIQKEVLGPGNYYLNRVAFRPVIVNTTNTTIDWDDSEDTKFDTLSVVSKDGFELKVGVKVVIRVQPEQAPFMVARIGSIENLITNVIHPLIDSSFRNQASSASAMQFLQDRHEQQGQALQRAISELSKYHVEVLSVLICQIVLPPLLMETQTNKVLALQRQSMFEEQQNSEAKRIAMERTKAEADKQSTLVAAQIDVQVADQIKQKTITIAQGDAEKIRLEGQGEADKILSIGKSTAQAYELTRQAVTPEGLVSIELMKLISTNNIKITPEIMITGGGEGGAMINAVLARLLRSDLRLPDRQQAPPQAT